MNQQRNQPEEVRVPEPCASCGGRGIFYDPRVEVGRYGRLQLCSCILENCRCGGSPPYRYWDEEAKSHWCSCRLLRKRLVEVNRLFKQAEIPERFKWKFQDDFSMEAPDGIAVPFARQVQSYVSTLVDSGEEPRRGFLFHGPPGTGKTMLGCIMLNELILHRCRPGRFLNLSLKYFQKLRDTFSEASEAYGHTWRIIEELCNLPYLMLDDFGVQRDTEWEKEMLYDLIDARYGEERFTIITTNHPLGEIQQLSEGRIYSRLVEMCHLVEMDGLDYRQHLHPQRQSAEDGYGT